jgi:multiple sugar transport system permease protein
LAIKAAARSGTIGQWGVVDLRGRNVMIALGVGAPILFYCLFLLFPMAYSVYMSLHDWNGASLTNPPMFVGLANFRYAILEDAQFHLALTNTFFFCGMVLPLGITNSLVLAALINSLPRIRGAYRVLYFLPVLTSEVASSIIWRYIYQPRFGLLNTLLIQVSTITGLQIPLPGWLNDPNLAMPLIVVMAIWKGMGYTIVIYLAGMQSIPETLYDAGHVDGASALQTFRYITVPMLRPTTVFILVTGVINGLQIFTPMYVMTQGGPVWATLSMVYDLYKQAFEYFKFGYASSLAVLLFLVILSLTILQAKFIRFGWDN